MVLLVAPTLYNEHEPGSTYFSFDLGASKTANVLFPRDEIQEASKKVSKDGKTKLKKNFWQEKGEVGF
ncbi:MAG: hypothetical protein OEZ58_12075 [Gammaproteobacteria bacterium]|nr:hypothetical protein [Gammaproteobacteria bacterium]MDH5729721.1 hypothetical protein [Gammaproteobacteria bacterium]